MIEPFEPKSYLNHQYNEQYPKSFIYLLYFSDSWVNLNPKFKKNPLRHLSARAESN